jgi:hypothetical protein
MVALINFHVLQRSFALAAAYRRPKPATGMESIDPPGHQKISGASMTGTSDRHAGY